MDEKKQKIREFLTKYTETKNLLDHEDIFAGGFVNSLFAMQLVLFVEKEFHVQMENEDLKIENFRSLNALAGLLERKLLQLTGANSRRSFPFE